MNDSFIYGVIKLTIEYHVYPDNPEKNHTETRAWYLDDNDNKIKTVSTSGKPQLKVVHAVSEYNKPTYQNDLMGEAPVINTNDYSLFETKYITH
jgi:hypothetical protein